MMNDAEILITVSKMVKYPRDNFVMPTDSWTGTDTARIKVALDFDKQSAAFKLRAIMENWDMMRINRELY